MRILKCTRFITVLILMNIMCSASFASVGQMRQDTSDATLIHPVSNELDLRLINFDDYVSGAVIGTILGFGSGHATQGRWEDGGSTFAAWETGFLGVAGISALSFIHTFDLYSNRGDVFAGMFLAAGIGFAVTRIFEIIDLWSVDHLAAGEEPSTAFVPAIGYNPENDEVNFGLAVTF